MCNLIGLLGLQNEDFEALVEKCEAKESFGEKEIAEFSKDFATICKKVVDDFEMKSNLKVKKVFCGEYETPNKDLDKVMSGQLLVHNDWFEEGSLVIILEEDLPSDDDLNAIFLDMSEYGFNAYWRSDDEEIEGETIKQQYDFGEYETGWFASGQSEEYMNYNDNTFLAMETSLCS